MKAIVQDRYGSPDVLQLREIDRPAFGDDGVLVRVHAASVHPDVWHVIRGMPYILRFMGAGLLKPTNPVPGTDMAGHVEAVGRNVTQFQPGDEVFGETVHGHQWKNGGAYAEYVSVPENALAVKPANVTFEQAAAVPTSGLIALQNLRGRVQPGQKVLINGAGGGLGMLAVQIVKSYGAEVTAVDSAGKQDMLRSIGADQVIDYTEEDFTHGDERYDLILDIPGNRSFSDLGRVLAPDGTYILIGHDLFGAQGGRFIGSGIPRFIKLSVSSPFGKQQAAPRPTEDTTDPLVVLKELMETGDVTPVIDSTYPLSEAPEAIRYLVEGSAAGKVVITV